MSDELVNVEIKARCEKTGQSEQEVKQELCDQDMGEAIKISIVAMLHELGICNDERSKIAAFLASVKTILVTHEIKMENAERKWMSDLVNKGTAVGQA